MTLWTMHLLLSNKNLRRVTGPGNSFQLVSFDQLRIEAVAYAYDEVVLMLSTISDLMQSAVVQLFGWALNNHKITQNRSIFAANTGWSYAEALFVSQTRSWTRVLN